VLRANLIINRVDLANAAYPGSIGAALVLGTLAGCGGRLIVDGLKFGWGALPGRAELSEPGWTSRSAFVAALAYWGSAHALRLLEPRTAAGLLITLMVRGGSGAAARAGALHRRRSAAAAGAGARAPAPACFVGGAEPAGAHGEARAQPRGRA
jgi:hypothetical protein